MTFHLASHVRVTAVREHLRTISGRRDPVTGAAVTNQVSLGWFVVVDLDEGGIAFPIGPERPRDIDVGDTLKLTLTKV